MKAIDEVLASLTEVESVKAVLLCECRILYQNAGICEWVSESFAQYFSETHAKLRKRVSSDPAVGETIDDLMSMVELNTE